MQEIQTESDLKEAIHQLENQHTVEGKLLKEQFYLAYDSIKPINLLKKTFKEAAASQELKTNIINTSAGLSAGFLSKLLLESAAVSPAAKLIGTTLIVGMTHAISQHPEVVRSLVNGLFARIRSRPGKREVSVNIKIT